MYSAIPFFFFEKHAMFLLQLVRMLFGYSNAFWLRQVNSFFFSKMLCGTDYYKRNWQWLLNADQGEVYMSNPGQTVVSYSVRKWLNRSAMLKESPVRLHEARYCGIQVEDLQMVCLMAQTVDSTL